MVLFSRLEERAINILAGGTGYEYSRYIGGLNANINRRLYYSEDPSNGCNGEIFAHIDITLVGCSSVDWTAVECYGRMWTAQHTDISSQILLESTGPVSTILRL
jgi:hypothetical protein